MSYFIYGSSLQGTSHLAGKVPCQDDNRFLDLGNGWVVAAVADGVGSAANAEIGSQIAVDTAVTFVAENMPLSYRENGIKRAIYLGFNAALKAIMHRAEQDHCPLESYDTTLTLAVFNGVNLYYGHSGDGAIFGLTVFGDYYEITKPNKGPDGLTVIPLRHGEDTWIIDACKEELTSVLLVTDGVREYALRPYLLGTGPADVYVPICAVLMHPSWYAKHRDYAMIVEEYLANRLSKERTYSLLSQIYSEAILDADTIPSALESVRSTNYVNLLIGSIEDDKTALAIINASEDRVPDKKPAAYYTEPDWAAKKVEVSKRLYPSEKPETGEGDTMGIDMEPAEQTADADEQVRDDGVPDLSDELGQSDQQTRTHQTRRKFQHFSDLLKNKET